MIVERPPLDDQRFAEVCRGRHTFATTERPLLSASSDQTAIPTLNVAVYPLVGLPVTVASSDAMLSAKNPDLPNRGVKEAHYVVLTGTSMPAILAEVSFVSSPTDENNLQSSTYRQQIAEALYSGIARYQASSRPVKMASASGKPTGR
jgi:hypothetical protein